MSPSCPRTVVVSAYVDGELAGFELAAFERHLQRCESCARLSAEARALSDAFRALPDLSPGFDLRPLIDQRLAAQGSPGRAPRSARRFPAAGWAPALATLGSLAGGFALGLTLAGAPAPHPSLAPPAAMAAFDVVPPGGICLVAASCPTRGASR
jgi:anti-sigma factor RsiW